MVLEEIPHSAAWRLVTTPCWASAVRNNAANPLFSVIQLKYIQITIITEEHRKSSMIPNLARRGLSPKLSGPLQGPALRLPGDPLRQEASPNGRPEEKDLQGQEP
jgi:hypothetical protein